MPFGDLEHMSLKDYLAQEAQRDSMWFFLHIPKTAGSSFSVELASKMRPYSNIVIDYLDRSKSHSEKKLESVENFLRENQVKPHRSASGHLTWRQFEKIRAAVPDMRLVTFLRDPIKRVISDYRYQRTPMHPLHEEFKKEHPNLLSYVQSKGANDKMANHLIGLSPSLTAEDLIEHIKTRFTFVGLVEMYPLSFTSMFAAMGHPKHHPTEHKRATPDTADTKVEVTPELRKMIREANPLDYAAFDYVQGLLRRHRDAIQAARAERGKA